MLSFKAMKLGEGLRPISRSKAPCKTTSSEESFNGDTKSNYPLETEESNELLKFMEQKILTEILSSQKPVSSLELQKLLYYGEDDPPSMHVVANLILSLRTKLGKDSIRNSSPNGQPGAYYIPNQSREKLQSYLVETRIQTAQDERLYTASDIASASSFEFSEIETMVKKALGINKSIQIKIIEGRIYFGQGDYEEFVKAAKRKKRKDEKRSKNQSSPYFLILKPLDPVLKPKGLNLETQMVLIEEQLGISLLHTFLSHVVYGELNKLEKDPKAILKNLVPDSVDIEQVNGIRSEEEIKDYLEKLFSKALEKYCDEEFSPQSPKESQIVKIYASLKERYTDDQIDQAFNDHFPILNSTTSPSCIS